MKKTSTILWWICRHQWKTHAKAEHNRYFMGAYRGKYIKEVLICEKCGRTKKITY